jgi:hypothetical protein
LEKVRRIGAAGASRAPGAGLLTATGERGGGNQLTATGLDEGRRLITVRREHVHHDDPRPLPLDLSQC